MKLDNGKILLILARRMQSRAMLAEKANLSRQTVTKVLKTGKCKPETIGKIAKALNVDVTEIIDLEEK